MKRLILTAVLALGLTLPIVAHGATRRRIYFWANVAAEIRAPGQPAMPEVIRPSTIILFADGSWALVKLHWTGWGSPVAHASGTSSASNGIPNQAQGKRIKTPAQITLSKPGRLFGHEVYRCYQLKVRPPATDLRGCVQGHKGFWFFAAPPLAR